MLRPATCAVRRAARAASSALRCSQGAASSALANAVSQPEAPRLNRIAACRELSTSVSKPTSRSQQEKDAGVQKAFDGERDPRVGELLELIEQSREEGDGERELQQSLELYEILKQRQQQGADAFEVAFSIARIYDAQPEDGETAVKYYEEALEILEAVSKEATAWGAYMRVTTLGALAVCHENLGQPEEAEKYFEDAIGAYEEHCEQASASDAGETDASDSDISILADLNATAAMIHYHYTGNLLAQERWEEAKNVTKIALVLAENSSMPAEDLEELQRCIHELLVEMD
ncbi:hypothetical protein PHYPSEUDO_007952 [Phytophthora pseudosyringae]|uniref:Tetratricopeptide SHNi-TPR domain-containing protein n=1 Tax=Phytophthora pseudosyringae TaxID=221518 RepID=A0A8T1WFM3_9STRA|nr:hypothetical protein PHYPSEUDO_007952 [Phytophthora pseudosyringae]